MAVSVLCKPFLGPCRRLSSVGSRATEDLQGAALVQLRPPNGGYLGQMGVAKGGSCLSACGFASDENRCNAARACRYWLTGAHRYLARPSTDQLSVCRSSPETATAPHTLGFAERARLQKRSAMSINMLLILKRRTRPESQYGGGNATQHKATSELHDDIATRSFSRCYPRQPPANNGATSTLPIAAERRSRVRCLPSGSVPVPAWPFASRAMGRRLEQEPSCWCAKVT